MANYKVINFKDGVAQVKEVDGDSGAVVSKDLMIGAQCWVSFDGSKVTVMVMSGGQLLVSDDSATSINRFNGTDTSALSGLELFNTLKALLI